MRGRRRPRPETPESPEPYADFQMMMKSSPWYPCTRAHTSKPSAEPSSFVFPSMLLNVSASAWTTMPVCAYFGPLPDVFGLRKKLPGVIRTRCDGVG